MSDLPTDDPTATTEPDEGAALSQQIEHGAMLYAERCAGCHGAQGEGTADAPPVVGSDAFPREPREGAARDVEFVTALDVFVWTSATMPGDNPGSLSQSDMLAIFAFDLDANGVVLDRPLDAALAESIVLNP